MSLVWMLEAAARKAPHTAALVWEHGEYDYSQFCEASERAAAVFRDLGVGRGDRVGVMTYNTPAFAIAAFGLWRAGAALIPINHKFTAREIAYVAAHSGSKVIIADVDFADRVREGAPDAAVLTCADDGTGEFDRRVREAAPWAGVEVGRDDVAEILYTSGTTGNPKGCVHTHAGIGAVPAFTTAAVGLRRDDRFLISMPIWHASPLNNWFLSMVYLGGTVVLQKEYHPVGFLEAVQRHRVTAFFGAPIAYLAPLKVLPSLDRSIAEFDLSSVRLWAYGGAPMGAQTVQTLQQAYGSDRFYQVYGMSEMGPVGTALYPEEQVRKAGAIGAGAMPGVDIRLVRVADGRDAQPGEIGEIWMRSDTRMRGYLDDEVATREAFVGDWYRTGDLARVDEDGYLFIVDRLKDIVITGGENVYSPEVEEALRQHPEITDAAVIGRPHGDWGETVVAVLESAQSLGTESIREFLKPTLAKYKIPREVVVVDQLPRNASGKVTKHVLRERLLQD